MIRPIMHTRQERVINYVKKEGALDDPMIVQKELENGAHFGDDAIMRMIEGARGEFPLMLAVALNPQGYPTRLVELGARGGSNSIFTLVTSHAFDVERGAWAFKSVIKASKQLRTEQSRHTVLWMACRAVMKWALWTYTPPSITHDLIRFLIDEFGELAQAWMMMWVGYDAHHARDDFDIHCKCRIDITNIIGSHEARSLIDYSVNDEPRVIRLVLDLLHGEITEKDRRVTCSTEIVLIVPPKGCSMGGGIDLLSSADVHLSMTFAASFSGTEHLAYTMTRALYSSLVIAAVAGHTNSVERILCSLPDAALQAGEGMVRSALVAALTEGHSEVARYIVEVGMQAHALPHHIASTVLERTGSRCLNGGMVKVVRALKQGCDMTDDEIVACARDYVIEVVEALYTLEHPEEQNVVS